MAANQKIELTANLVEFRGTWRFCIHYKDENKKRRQKWIDTRLPIRGNKRNAQAMEQDILAEWTPKLLAIQQPNAKLCNLDKQGKEYNPSIQINGNEYKKILFADYMLTWLDSVKSGLQITTFAEYKRTIEKNICPFFRKKGLYLEDLKPCHIKEYYDFLLKTVSPNTVLHQHANIRKALQAAVEDENINLIINPADRVKRPQKVKYISEVYSKDDLMRLFSVIGNDTLFLVILMGATYGLRRSELAGIKWDAIDWGRKTITIKASAIYCKVAGKYVTVVKPVLKNKSSYRTFPLTPEVEAALHTEKAKQEKNMQTYGRKYNMEFADHVFVNTLGELIKPNYFSKHFKLVLKKNDLKVIRFHDLRHTCATLLMDGGVSIKDIQHYLGHSQLATTADIYTHRDFTHQMKTTDIAGQIIRAVWQ